MIVRLASLCIIQPRHTACWGLGRGFCPIGSINPQCPLLIVKADKKGQRTEKICIAAVYKELLIELAGS